MKKIMYLEDARGFTATITTYKSKVVYVVSHRGSDYKEKREELPTSSMDTYALTGLLLKGLLTEGFILKDYI